MARCLSFIFIVILFACNRQPFVESKVELEEKGDCKQVPATFRMTSNFGGERFEFEKCLASAYDSKSLTTSRSGDTVVVRFNSNAAPSKLFNVTLDIDSYPAYHFITVDQETFPITATDE